MDPIEFATGRLPVDRKTAELAMRSKDEWRAFADAASRPPLPEGRRRLGRKLYEFPPGGREAYEYLTLYDPERALREVAAGYRILERHALCPNGGGFCKESTVRGPVCPELADLLYRWADHPAYEPAWLPEGL